MYFVSTFRPTELGHVEREILNNFANNESTSVYSIYKKMKETPFRQSIAYKNVHKRVKRLVQLNLIEAMQEAFPRRAKHYKINATGLINYLNNSVTENHRFILFNKDNIVIQALLLEFLEEATLDSFYLLKKFPTRDLAEYLSDCCSVTCTFCRNSWNEIGRYKLEDILPSEDVIQKYMSSLDGKPVDQEILYEIEQYRERLERRWEKEAPGSPNVNRFNYYGSYRYDRNSDEKEPPFPMNFLYLRIDMLRNELEYKAKLIAFHLVSELGSIINSEENLNNRENFEEDMFEYARDYSLQYILKDKKLFELLQITKRDFDVGYKQFLYYQR
jgi:hypothetical protein